MVETTTEYKQWAGTRANLHGAHYVSAAECLAAEGVLSSVYPPQLDREVFCFAKPQCLLCLSDCLDGPLLTPAELRLRSLLPHEHMDVAIMICACTVIVLC